VKGGWTYGCRGLRISQGGHMLVMVVFGWLLGSDKVMGKLLGL
jgi:hypothetical protein